MEGKKKKAHFRDRGVRLSPRRPSFDVERQLKKKKREQYGRHCVGERVRRNCANKGGIVHPSATLLFFFSRSSIHPDSFIYKYISHLVESFFFLIFVSPLLSPVILFCLRRPIFARVQMTQ